MIMKRIAVLALATLLAALTACTAPTPSAGAETTLAPVAGAEAPTPTQEISAQLTMMTYLLTQEQAQQVQAAWAERYPAIELAIETEPDQLAYIALLEARNAQGDLPDIFAVPPGSYAVGLYEDLLPLEDRAEALWGGSWQEKFLPAALEQAGQSLPDVRLMPGTVTVSPLLVYDRKALDALGVGEVATYEDVLSALAAASSDEKLLPGVGVSARDGDMLPGLFLGLLEQTSPGILQKLNDGTAAWDDPAVTQALTALRALFDDGFFSENANRVSQGTVIDNLIAGDMGGRTHYLFALADSNLLARLTSQAAGLDVSAGARLQDAQVGMMPLPDVTGGDAQGAAMQTDIAFGISFHSENADAAFSFLAWLCGGEGAMELSRATGRITSSSDYPFAAIMTGSAENAALSAALSLLRSSPYLADENALHRMGPILSELALGAIDVQAAQARLLN